MYGSSAGAINATYFLSGQREGVDIYSQDITNTDFIDLRRLLGNKDDETHREHSYPCSWTVFNAAQLENYCPNFLTHSDRLTCSILAGPALDLSFLLDYVMNEIKPLDWQAVVDSPIPLKVNTEHPWLRFIP